jgi:hypothetical protein
MQVAPRHAAIWFEHCDMRQVMSVHGLPPSLKSAASIAQLNAWSKKYCVLGHPSATQLATHETLTLGGIDMKSMHLMAQVKAWKQFLTVHVPQSAGQLAHVS